MHGVRVTRHGFTLPQFLSVLWDSSLPIESATVQHEFQESTQLCLVVFCKNLERFDGSRYDATPPAVLGRLVRSCRQRANVYDRGRQVYQGWEALPNSVRKVGLRVRDYVHACTLLVSYKLVVRPTVTRAGFAFLGRAVCGCCGVELAVCAVLCWRV